MCLSGAYTDANGYRCCCWWGVAWRGGEKAGCACSNHLEVHGLGCVTLSATCVCYVSGSGPRHCRRCAAAFPPPPATGTRSRQAPGAGGAKRWRVVEAVHLSACRSTDRHLCYDPGGLPGSRHVLERRIHGCERVQVLLLVGRGVAWRGGEKAGCACNNHLDVHGLGCVTLSATCVCYVSGLGRDPRHCRRCAAAFPPPPATGTRSRQAPGAGGAKR
jgi:hypothetical protein